MLIFKTMIRSRPHAVNNSTSIFFIKCVAVFS